jgi:15,16-dihydrobiliverdin:ferredoxin oxidoreductase
MDAFLKKALDHIENKFSIESISIPDTLKHISSPSGLFDMHCYNWKAERIRKISFFQLKVDNPCIEAFGISIYPKPSFDVPILGCDCNLTEKIVNPVINFIPLFNDALYLRKYIEPMKPIFEKYNAFPQDEVRDFYKPYLSPYYIYGKFDKTYLEEVRQCSIEYLSLYLDLLCQAKELQDASYRSEVENAHKKYIFDFVTNDISRDILGKIIGKEVADRVFQEIIV